MIASATLLFTQSGKEISFGFWIMTNFIIFLIHSVYIAAKSLIKQYKQDKKNEESISTASKNDEAGRYLQPNTDLKEELQDSIVLS